MSYVAPDWEGNLASIGHRAIARVIDTVLIGVPVVAAAVVWGRFGAIVIGGALSAGYEILMLSSSGQTVGKRVAGIRVIAVDGLPPRVDQATKRWALPYGAGLVPYVGFILSLFIVLRAVAASDRRGVHDLVAGTWVVADPVSGPLD